MSDSSPYALERKIHLCKIRVYHFDLDNLKIIHLFLLFVFSRQGFSLKLCRTGWPWFLRDSPESASWEQRPVSPLPGKIVNIFKQLSLWHFVMLWWEKWFNILNIRFPRTETIQGCLLTRHLINYTFFLFSFFMIFEFCV